MTATQYPISSWLTFRSVQIPVGSIINKATITFTCFEGDESSTVNVDITGHLDSNSTSNPSAGMSTYPFNLTTWPRTSTVVNWEMGSWTTDSTYTTPDIACIIQEIIAGGWTQGNAIKFFFDDGGAYSGANAHKAKDYDENSSETAQLKIWYSPAYSETGTGGILVGGEAEITQYFSFNETAEGGTEIGGTATVTQIYNYDETMSGGFLIGGEFGVHTSTTYSDTMTGGVVLGSAPFANGYRYRKLITVPAGAVSANIGKYYLGVQADLPHHIDGDTVQVETIQPTTWVKSDNLTITGNKNMVMTSGGGWSASAYSAEKYVSNCVATATATAINVTMFGLNTDPSVNDSYTSIDYAFYFAAGGLAYAFENGSNAASLAAYVPGDVGQVVYDGINVRYLLNGSVKRTVARPIGLPLHFDSSFGGAGSGLTNCSLRPFGYGHPADIVFGPEMLTNTAFAGYVAGSPGTPPTGWTNANITGSISGPTLTFDAVASRRDIYQTYPAAPGVYRLENTAAVNSGTPNMYDPLWWIAPAGTTARYFIDGVEGPNTRVISGTSRVAIELNVITSGTITYRCGVGTNANRTENITITDPSLKYSPGYYPVPTILPNEIRQFDSGNAHIFFKTPLKSSIDNNFYLYYGK